MSKDYNERELEKGLVEHITHFLLELGAGFAYIGRQVPLQVGERDFLLTSFSIIPGFTVTWSLN